MKEMIYINKPQRKILDSGIYKGFKYVILNLGYHPTAYVENKIGVDDYTADELDDISVHGGFTYLGQRMSADGDDTEYLGWDYGHYGDYSLTDELMPISLRINGKKWTTQEILDEVHTVIDQLEKLI